MPLRVRHIARNVLFNWIATFANMAAGFFMAPFIVHRLGTVAYGVWVLAISVVTYLSLLDLGMQSSVLRFVSKGYTQGDHQAASDTLSAALWVRLQISALVVLLSVGLAIGFPIWFKIPLEMANEARKAVLLIGATTALTLSLGVFGGVLSGLNRYDLQSFVTLTNTTVRIIGVVLVLVMHHGIVAIAACEFVAAVFSNILLLILARKLYPALRVRLAKPSKQVLRQIQSYSFYAFLTTVAVQLVYQTDNMVVGAFVSAAAVTFYAIGNSLCRYAGQIISSMTLTFVPAASTYEAAGDVSGLKNLYCNGTRATLALALPILVTLILRGRTFIRLWMGPEYQQRSGTVLIILASALFFSYANRVASAITFGIEKHKTAALWSIGEGVSNLVLSVILVHWFGIYGVAIGTLIPSLVVHLGLWPYYIPKLVPIRTSEVVGRIWAPMFLSAVPFAIASYEVDAYFPTNHMVIFFTQVAATLPIFVVTLGIIFRKSVRLHVLPQVRSFFSPQQTPGELLP